MNGWLAPRLRAPVLTAAFGMVLAVAAAGVAGWTAAVPILAASLPPAAAYYWIGGSDRDTGALIGGRADERQILLRRWIQVFAAAALFAASSVGAIVAAVWHLSPWPFAVVAGVGAAWFVAGLALDRDGGTGGSGSGMRRIGRLDERQVWILVRCVQRAGLAMVLVALAGDVLLTGRSGDDAFRLLLVVYGIVAIAGMVFVWPRRAGTGDS